MRERIGLGKAAVGLALAAVLAAVAFLQSCTTSDVTSVVISSVAIDPSGADLVVGDSVHFTAVVRENDGTVLSGATVTWSSEDGTVVSIGQDGTAHGLKAGSADIQASFRGMSGSAAVNVTPRPAIAVSPDSVSFSGSVGGAPPPAQVVQVTNGGGGTLDGLVATVQYGVGQPTGWLDVSLDSSSAPADLTLTPTTSLPAGTYDATVTLTGQKASNSPFSIPVSFTLVEDRPIIHLSPDSVTLQGDAAGSPVTTNVQVTNTGAGSLTGLGASIWYETTTGSWLSASLSRDTAPATVAITADPGSLAPGVYHGEVRVTSPVAVTSPVPASVTFVVGPSANVAITKTGPASALEGDEITYTLQASNAGPQTADSVVVTDTLPLLTTLLSASAGGVSRGVLHWLVGSLATGQTASMTMTLRLATGSAGTLTNVAHISSSLPDPDPSDNTSSVSTTVSVPVIADLSVAKSGPGSAVAGERITYTVDVSNAGPDTAQGVAVVDTLPTGVTFVSASAGAEAAGVVTWNVGSLAASATQSASIVVDVDPATTGDITNRAWVHGTSVDSTANNDSSAVTTTASQTADVAVTKTASTSAVAGAQISYTIAVQNSAGPSNASGVTVTDSLPAALTFVSATGGGTYDPTTRTVTWNVGTLAVGSSTNLGLTAMVDAGASGSMSNTARVSTASADPSAGNDTSTVTTTVVQGADLAVTKTGPATDTAGTQISYAIAVDHVGGTSDASGVTVTDTLPAALTFVSATGGGTYSATTRAVTWSVGTVPVGGSTSLGLTATVGAGASGSVSNRAWVGSTSADPVSTNDSSTATTAVSHSADLSVTKTGPASVNAGANLTYTIGVSHVGGPSDASGVTVTDTLPAALTFVSATGGGTYNATSRAVTWNVGVLAVGGSTSVGLTATVAAAATGSVSNRAWVGSTTADPVSTNDSSTVTTTLTRSADLSVTKSGPATASAGSNVSYTIAVQNSAGPSNVSGVTVTDTLSSSLTFVSETGGGTYNATSRAVTWNVGALAVGGSTSVGLTATVAAGATGSVSNRAWVGSTSPDPVSANDSSTVTTTLTQSADVSVTKSGPATATAGSNVSYTIAVQNSGGPSDAGGVTVTDTLPATLTYVSSTGGGTYNATSRAVTWSVGTLTMGASSSFGLTATVDAGATGSLSNRAWVGSTTADPVSTNDSSTVTTTVGQSADLAVTKTAPATDTAGTNLTYTIRVRHVGGTSDASGVVLTDTLPGSLTYVSATGGGTYNATSRAVTWNVGTLAVGGSTTLGLAATVAAGASGSVSNTATVSSTSTDANASNDTSTTTATVGQTADLAVVKSGPASATAGTNLTYTIAVNHVGGTSDASGVTVTDTLPSTLTFVSATGGGTYDQTSRAVTWTVGTLAVGGNTSLGLTVTVDPAATGSVSNRAWVGSTSTDPVTSNDSSTVTTTVTRSADVSVTKSGPASATAGTNLTSLTFVSATGGGSYNATSRAVTWTVGTLAVDSSTSLGLTATAAAGANGSVSNRAWVGSTSPDPVSTNDSSTVTTTLAQSADLSVAKSGPASATAGSNVSYTIAVQNSGGPSDASGVTVTDTLPASLTYVSSTGGGSYNATSRAVTWNVGTLVAGGSTSLGLTATIDAGATGSVSNRAWVGTTTADPVSTNDSSTVTTTLSQSADLAVTKTGPATDTAGTQISYTIGVSHVGGTSTATGVTVTDTLPTALTFVSATGGGSYNATSRAVTWTVGTLAVDSSTSLGLTAT
ncbi:MAG: hypothetical protein P8099_17365, partial [Gemmatimonadota bacterium]